MRRTLAFLWHLLRSKSRYGVHSPFVFDFHRTVLRHRATEQGARIEALRCLLMRSTDALEIPDFGAGSRGKAQLHRQIRVADLARKSARRRREGELLLRLCRRYQPQRCLELGTNLGISALYQLAGLPPSSRMITLEGAPALSELASRHVAEMGFDATFFTGEFSQLLDTQIDLAALRPDYVFIDGNHRYEATLTYFHRLLPHLCDGGIMVFDDINWSADMQRAWREICAHPEVSLSIDLFTMGICFIRRKQAKEHFFFRFFPF